jgi:hypothetical protein
VKWLIYSNVWVAFCAACFSLISTHVFEGKSPFLLLFGGTLFLYSFHRIYKLYYLKQALESGREKWMIDNKKTVYALTFIGLSIATAEFFRLNIFKSNLFVLAALAVLISIFYVVRIGKRNFREIPYLKIVWVTLTYVAFTSVIGYPFLSLTNIQQELPLLMGLWLIILSITLNFDIRDLEIDNQITLTWPQKLGMKGTYLLSIGLSAFGLLHLAFITDNCVPFLLINGICLSVFYWFVFRRYNQDLFVSFYGEGLIAITGLSFYLLNI